MAKKQSQKNYRKSIESTEPDVMAEVPDAIRERCLPGIAVRSYGKFFDVRLRDEDRTLLATMRGTMKRNKRRTDLVAVGDRVWVQDVGEGEAVIEAVEPRTRVLARLARNTLDVEQVVLANPDQAIFIFAAAEPDPHPRLLDRFLILAEVQGVPPVIVVNKMDRAGEAAIPPEVVFAPYEQLYPVHYVSVKQGRGVEDVRQVLAGRVTVIAGPSGVGKSSLLNALDPSVVHRVGEISDATGKGRHTTTSTVLVEMGTGTYVADTPGIRALALHGVPPDVLPTCYPEFRPLLEDCEYEDCSHMVEPGCAIRAAVAAGKIDRGRYDGYCSLRRGDVPDSVGERVSG